MIEATSQKIAPGVRFGHNVQIRAESIAIGEDVVIGNDVTIAGREIVIEDRAQIQDRVRISAEHFSLGYRSYIDQDCKLASLGGRASEIRFGDNCLFAASNSALVPNLVIGDYVKIHNHTLISGFKPCYIGHNSWIGQNCVLNANDVLYIGNNVGIGTYSSIWTHAFFGELLEGFAVFNVAPTIIEDDVWIVGAYNVISPGLTVGNRSMVLTSSVVAKDVPPEHTVAGVPARDLTDRIPPVHPVSVEQKVDMMRGFIKEFVEAVYSGQHRVIEDGYEVIPFEGESFRVLVRDAVDADIRENTPPALVYVKSADWQNIPQNMTVFDLTTKQYSKCRTDAEIQIIGFMNAYRARFVPAANPRVGIRPTGGK